MSEFSSNHYPRKIELDKMNWQDLDSIKSGGVAEHHAAACNFKKHIFQQFIPLCLPKTLSRVELFLLAHIQPPFGLYDAQPTLLIIAHRQTENPDNKTAGPYRKVSYTGKIRIGLIRYKRR